MDLGDYLKALSPDERRQLADAAGTTESYMPHLMGGHRRPSTELSRSLVEASRRLWPDDAERHLELHHCRPDIWPATEASHSGAVHA